MLLAACGAVWGYRTRPCPLPGSMVGSGIYIVSAEMARQIGNPGGLLAARIITGWLTIAAALSYSELAVMMPWA